VKVMHGRLAWIRRLSFTAVLIAALIAPGPMSSGSPGRCTQPRCAAAGTVRWARSLPGSWIVQDGTAGTIPEQGQAYAALGTDVAAVGLGMTVWGYAADTGQPLWTAGLTGFPPGAAIMSVRVWPGVVTAGVSLPPGTGAGAATAPVRDEVVLRADTGRVLHVYPAAQFGGAVAASAARTVIVGQHSVTSYANRTGRVLWSRPTGPVPQAWQVDGGHLYMAVAASGQMGRGGGAGASRARGGGAGASRARGGGAGASRARSGGAGASTATGALRRITLGTGAQRLIRPPGRSFTGTLSLAFRGVVLFTAPTAIRAYSETSGRLLWHYPDALPDAVDATAGRLYLISGTTLIELNPGTGRIVGHVAGAAVASSSGLYAAWNGDVLGIDHGGLGKAWGYDVATQQVVWSSRSLPWPHYFVDLSGIGGSAPPELDGVLLASCAQVGAQSPGNAAPRCARPQLVVLDR
jgi:hypothetical protein